MPVSVNSGSPSLILFAEGGRTDEEGVPESPPWVEITCTEGVPGLTCLEVPAATFFFPLLALSFCLAFN
ncbi:hypothetical protein A2U01_0086446, partial [Trifolium medium]|nr:hypothetical protein [Trifolium medium]